MPRCTGRSAFARASSSRATASRRRVSPEPDDTRRRASTPKNDVASKCPSPGIGIRLFGAGHRNRRRDASPRQASRRSRKGTPARQAKPDLAAARAQAAGGRAAQARQLRRSPYAGGVLPAGGKGRVRRCPIFGAPRRSIPRATRSATTWRARCSRPGNWTRREPRSSGGWRARMSASSTICSATSSSVPAN